MFITDHCAIDTTISNLPIRNTVKTQLLNSNLEQGRYSLKQFGCVDYVVWAWPLIYILKYIHKVEIKLLDTKKEIFSSPDIFGPYFMEWSCHSLRILERCIYRNDFTYPIDINNIIHLKKKKHIKLKIKW